jgi:hypothetical protein
MVLRLAGLGEAHRNGDGCQNSIHGVLNQDSSTATIRRLHRAPSLRHPYRMAQSTRQNRLGIYPLDTGAFLPRLGTERQGSDGARRPAQAPAARVMRSTLFLYS